MAKKKAHHPVHHFHRSPKRQTLSGDNYLVIVRGWMLVVAFALMLGVGAVVGNFINQQFNQSTPTVAGAATAR